MIGENDWLIGCEQRIKILIAQSVRMFALRLQRHQVHDVDDANSSTRENAAAADRYRRQRFQCRHIAAARHHHVRLSA